MSCANEQEYDVRPVIESLGGAQNRFELVTAAQIARVADDEFADHPPFLAQRIRLGRHRLDDTPIRPIVNHGDSIFSHASAMQIFGHSFTDCHVHSRTNE